VIAGLLAFVAVIALLSQFLIISGGDSSSPAKIISTSLRLNEFLGSRHAAEATASRAKLFEHHGIAVELKEQGEGVDSIAAVVGGTDTFGVADSLAFLDARAKGQPIVAFAAGFLESGAVFYALERSGIRSPQDFIGRRVGRQAGTHGAILYDALLSNVGIARSQIREISAETDLDALINDRVDVISGRIGREGFLLDQKGLSYTVIRVSDYGIHIPDTVYFATEKTLLNRSSLCVQFLRGVIAGWGMVYANAAKSVPLIVDAAKNLTPEQVQFELAAQREFVMPLGRRIGEFDDQQWKQLRAILTKARVLDGPVDLSQATNYEILKEVYRKPITFGN
jgi:NitT/TauT family transport system substrate-binding protein